MYESFQKRSNINLLRAVNWNAWICFDASSQRLWIGTCVCFVCDERRIVMATSCTHNSWIWFKIKKKKKVFFPLNWCITFIVIKNIHLQDQKFPIKSSSLLNFSRMKFLQAGKPRKRILTIQKCIHMPANFSSTLALKQLWGTSILSRCNHSVVFCVQIFFFSF